MPAWAVWGCPGCGEDVDQKWIELCGRCDLELCWLCFWDEANLCDVYLRRTGRDAVPCAQVREMGVDHDEGGGPTTAGLPRPSGTHRPGYQGVCAEEGSTRGRIGPDGVQETEQYDTGFDGVPGKDGDAAKVDRATQGSSSETLTQEWWTQTEPSTSRDRFTGPHDEYPMLETVVKPKVKVVQVCDVPSDAGLKKGPWAEHDPAEHDPEGPLG